MSQVHQPSKKYTNVARLVHLRQVHPLKLAASVQICEICGRSSPAEGPVNSVQSVVCTLLLRRQGYLRYYLPQSNHLCRSVQSVGGSFAPKPSVLICEICGRTTVWLVGALLALASGKAERRQVHPLKLHLCNLWENLRTLTICANLCNLWEVIPNSSFCANL